MYLRAESVLSRSPHLPVRCHSISTDKAKTVFHLYQLTRRSVEAQEQQRFLSLSIIELDNDQASIMTVKHPEVKSDSSPSASSIQIDAGPILTKAVLEDATLVTDKGTLITKDGTIVTTGDVDPANPFSDPQVRDYYISVYEEAKYECRHAFDADATWTEEEERKVVKKLDWHGKCFVD